MKEVRFRGWVVGFFGQLNDKSGRTYRDSRGKGTGMAEGEASVCRDLGKRELEEV
jgi:hypothetical protein